MEWAWTIFAIGTFWFWALMVVSTIILLSCIEYGKGFGATVTLLGTLLILNTFGGVKVFAYIFENPETVLWFLAGYLAVGVLWSLAKWWFFLHKALEEYEERKMGFLRQHRVAGAAIPDNLKSEWVRFLSGYGEIQKFPPEAKRHADRIVTWMCYWPWSMAWTILNDPIKKLFKHIFAYIQELYQKISNHVFRGVKDDFSAPRDGGEAPEEAPAARPYVRRV